MRSSSNSGYQVPGPEDELGSESYEDTVHFRLSGACCEARGIKAIPLLSGAGISTMSLLPLQMVESEKVLVF